MNDWGVPDWRHRNGYVEYQHWVEWKWQFLRRRQDYRAAWSQWRGQGLGKCWRLVGPRRLGVSGPDELIDTLASAPQSQTKPDAMTQANFGLRFLVNPALSDDWLEEMWEDVRIVGDVISLGAADGYHDYQAGNSRYIRFDLDGDIHAQLADAKAALLRFQHDAELAPRGNKRPTGPALVRALRVLDAKDAGATNREIGGVLAKASDDPVARVKRLYAEARGLQDRLAPIL